MRILEPFAQAGCTVAVGIIIRHGPGRIAQGKVPLGKTICPPRGNGMAVAPKELHGIVGTNIGIPKGAGEHIVPLIKAFEFRSDFDSGGAVGGQMRAILGWAVGRVKFGRLGHL